MPSKNRQNGCRLYGRLRAIGGAAGENSVFVRPLEAVTYRGVQYTTATLRVRVEDDGTWSCIVPPGQYEVTVLGQSRIINVPVGIESLNFTDTEVQE